jgi:hypothetical protein
MYSSSSILLGLVESSLFFEFSTVIFDQIELLSLINKSHSLPSVNNVILNSLNGNKISDYYDFYYNNVYGKPSNSRTYSSIELGLIKEKKINDAFFNFIKPK